MAKWAQFDIKPKKKPINYRVIAFWTGFFLFMCWFWYIFVSFLDILSRKL